MNVSELRAFLEGLEKTGHGLVTVFYEADAGLADIQEVKLEQTDFETLVRIS